MKKLVFLSMLATLFAFSCAPSEPPAEPAPEPAAKPAPAPEPAAAVPSEMSAVARLLNADGEEIGVAKFAQVKRGGVRLVAEVAGVERDGAHGFHVHAVGECKAPDFKSAGGHFNPKRTDHACPPNPERHAGDFGNIEIVEGNGSFKVTSKLVSLTPGKTSILGKAVILHAGTDDCVGQPTGEAGGRLACGVIEVAGEAEAEGGDGGDGGEADGGEGGEGVQ